MPSNRTRKLKTLSHSSKTGLQGISQQCIGDCFIVISKSAVTDPLFWKIKCVLLTHHVDDLFLWVLPSVLLLHGKLIRLQLVVKEVSPYCQYLSVRKPSFVRGRSMCNLYFIPDVSIIQCQWVLIDHWDLKVSLKHLSNTE